MAVTTPIQESAPPVMTAGSRISTGCSSFQFSENLLKKVACLAFVYFGITGLHEFDGIEIITSPTILRRL